jgi:glutamate racemase
VIACNTLSILYQQTAFARAGRVPVTGIIDAGIALFSRSMAAAAGSRIALFGTRITIASGIHRDGLIASGVAPSRIAAAGCHGLAGAIEQDVDSSEVDRQIEDGVSAIAFPGVASGPTFAGLCCTHFGYVADRFRTALERRLGQAVRILDPNQGLVDRVVREVAGAVVPGLATGPAVSVVSKVGLDERARAGIARLVSGASPATADALIRYHHVPDLF